VRDNLETFRNPECGCEWWKDGQGKDGVQVSPQCKVHGEGTRYWDGMTAERDRIFAEMQAQRTIPRDSGDYEAGGP